MQELQAEETDAVTGGIFGGYNAPGVPYSPTGTSPSQYVQDQASAQSQINTAIGIGVGVAGLLPEAGTAATVTGIGLGIDSLGLSSLSSGSDGFKHRAN